MKRILFAFILIFPWVAYAQKKDSINYKQVLIINGKKFKIYNNWLSAGAGPGFNTGVPQMQTNLGVDYNFHILAEYFQIGVALAGNDFGNWNNYRFHLGYGKRYENMNRNFAFFAGPAYVSGYEFVNGNFRNFPYNSLGLYAQAQYIHKLVYDVGIGPAVFVEYSEKRMNYGIRLDFYFSGAYKGAHRGIRQDD